MGVEAPTQDFTTRQSFLDLSLTLTTHSEADHLFLPIALSSSNRRDFVDDGPHLPLNPCFLPSPLPLIVASSPLPSSLLFLSLSIVVLFRIAFRSHAPASFKERIDALVFPLSSDLLLHQHTVQMVPKKKIVVRQPAVVKARLSRPPSERPECERRRVGVLGRLLLFLPLLKALGLLLRPAHRSCAA